GSKGTEGRDRKVGRDASSRGFGGRGDRKVGRDARDRGFGGDTRDRGFGGDTRDRGFGGLRPPRGHGGMGSPVPGGQGGPSPRDKIEHMSTRVSARVSAISESATLAVDAKAKALKAAGRPVIGFGAGEPDFPTPDYIVEAAARAWPVPRFHHYTPAAGLPELREAVAAKTARDSGLQVSPGQVLITNGGKHAVYEAFATLLDPGDEVLLPTPYWTTYPESIALAGGTPVTVATDEQSGYLVSVEQLEAH